MPCRPERFPCTPAILTGMLAGVMAMLAAVATPAAAQDSLSRQQQDALLFIHTIFKGMMECAAQLGLVGNKALIFLKNNNSLNNADFDQTVTNALNKCSDLIDPDSPNSSKIPTGLQQESAVKFQITSDICLKNANLTLNIIKQYYTDRKSDDPNKNTQGQIKILALSQEIAVSEKELSNACTNTILDAGASIGISLQQIGAYLKSHDPKPSS